MNLFQSAGYTLTPRSLGPKAGDDIGQRGRIRTWWQISIPVKLRPGSHAMRFTSGRCSGKRKIPEHGRPEVEFPIRLTAFGNRLPCLHRLQTDQLLRNDHPTANSLWSRLEQDRRHSPGALPADAVTPGQGPAGASFRSADELEALLLQAGRTTPMTPARKARICREWIWGKYGLLFRSGLG